MSWIEDSLDWITGTVESIWDWVNGGGGGGGLPGWAGTAIGFGIDLFNYSNQRDAAKAVAEAQRRELDAIKKAAGIQTDRDIADLRKGQRRAVASVTAMAAASGVRSDWGTPVIVREDVHAQYEQDISRTLEDAELRAESISLQQNYISKARSISNQAAGINLAGNLLSRVGT